MSFGDFMGLAALLLAITAVVALLVRGYTRRLAYLERKLEITAGQTAEKAAQYASHTGELEARVRVLERIATEGGSQIGLAAQIDALRDAPHRDGSYREVSTQ